MTRFADGGRDGPGIHSRNMRKATGWLTRFDEPIVLDDGTRLTTLRDAIQYLAKTVPKAEQNHEKLLNASDHLTRSAEHGYPLYFARAARSCLQPPKATKAGPCLHHFTRPRMYGSAAGRHPVRLPGADRPLHFWPVAFGRRLHAPGSGVLPSAVCVVSEFVVPFQRKKPAAIGVKAAFPGFIEPALASSIEKVPTGDRWLHEIKFDGYRVQLHIANDDIKVFTRRGNDWTKRFKKIADDAYLISARSAIMDGEIVVPAADGTTDFSVLQNELKGKSTKIVMVAFDLLYLNGYDLRKLPLVERKAHLKKLIAGTDVQFSESFEVDGDKMYEHACSVGLEGVVSKVRDSKYSSGRGNDWVKKTCAQRETLTIAGFAMDGSKWDGLGSRLAIDDKAGDPFIDDLWLWNSTRPDSNDGRADTIASIMTGRRPRMLLPRHLLENPLHHAGADAELLADLEDAIALIPERHDLSLNGRFHPASS